MQENYYRETLEPVSVLIESDDEASTITFALHRLLSAIELDAITTTEEVRTQVPQLLEDIRELTSRIESGEREILVGSELRFAGTALAKLVGDYDAALADAQGYTEMTADLENPAMFVLHASMARGILFPNGERSMLFE